MNFRKDNVQRDFEEFMTESQQLEREYEVTIDQNEKKIIELKTSNMKTQNEIDSLKVNMFLVIMMIIYTMIRNKQHRNINCRMHT